MGFPSRLAPGAKANNLNRASDSNAALTTSGKTRALCACHSTPIREGYPCTRCSMRVCKLPAVCPACGLTLILSTHLARSYHHLFPLRNWVDVSWAQARASPATGCFSCLAPFPAVPSRQTRQEPDGNNTAEAGSSRPKIVLNSKHKEPSAGRHGDNYNNNDSIETRRLVKGISESSRYACVVCKNHFCIDCDVFSHEILHNCPGCQSAPPREQVNNVVLDDGDPMAIDGPDTTVDQRVLDTGGSTALAID